MNSCNQAAATEIVLADCQKAFAQALLDAFEFVAAALRDGSFVRPEQFVEHLESWVGLALMCLTNPIKMCFVDAKQQVDLRIAVGSLLAAFGNNPGLAADTDTTMRRFYAKFAKTTGWMAVRLHKFDLACKDDYANLLPVILNHGTLIRSLPTLQRFFEKFTQKVFSLRGRAENEKKGEKGTAITIDPDASTSDVTISKAVLEFCLNTHISLTQLTEAMTDDHSVDMGGAHGRTRGEVFCNRYGELINQTILSDGSCSIRLDEYLRMLCHNRCSICIFTKSLGYHQRMYRRAAEGNHSRNRG